MRFLPYDIVSIDPIRIGLVVLQSDETYRAGYDADARYRGSLL
jgi:hypothetical protein